MTVKLKNMRNSDGDRQSSHYSKKKTVICYICEKTAKEYHLSSHLYFGSLECRQCQFKFRYCSKYYSFRKSKDPKNINPCEHRKLRYTRDPVDYLERKLRKDIVKSRSRDAETSMTDVLKEMKNYLNIIKPLEYRSPWKYAIEKLKKYVSCKNECRTHGKINSNHHFKRDKYDKRFKSVNHPKRRDSCTLDKEEKILSGSDKDKINHDAGDVGVPQFVEETVISRTEWDADNISVEEFDECNKSITISLNVEEDTNKPLTVETIYISKHEEESVSLIVEDPVFTSCSPLTEIDSNMQMSENQVELSTTEAVTKKPLPPLDVIEEQVCSTGMIHKAGIEQKVLIPEKTDENQILQTEETKENNALLPDSEDEALSEVKTNENLSLARTETSGEEVESVSISNLNLKKKTSTEKDMEEKKANALNHSDSAESEAIENRQLGAGKVIYSKLENIKENNNNEPLEKVDGLITNYLNDSNEAMFRIARVRNELDPWAKKEVSTIGMHEDSDVSPPNHKRFVQKKPIFKGYLSHQQKKNRPYRTRNIKDSMSKTRKRDSEQGNSVKIKKYNLRSRRHKPSEAFLQRLDAYEKKKLWEKLVPIAKMLRKLTADGNLGCLPTLYLPIDSVEADDDFLVDVLLSQVFDKKQLRKMLMYVPSEGGRDEIAVIVDEVKKAIDQISNLPERLNENSSDDIVTPVVNQFNESNVSEERVKGRTESITKSLDRIIFGKNVQKKRSKTYYINPPADGYYFVVSYPSQPLIKECPMCYYRVFPAMFALNLVTNLAVTKCVGCGLTIYVVQESDDIDYQPKIVFKGDNTSDNDSLLPMPARYKLFDSLGLQGEDSDESI